VNKEGQSKTGKYTEKNAPTEGNDKAHLRQERRSTSECGRSQIDRSMHE